jgi:hypothetical protein
MGKAARRGLSRTTGSSRNRVGKPRQQLLFQGRMHVEVGGLRGVSQRLGDAVLGRTVRQDSLLRLDEMDAVEPGAHLELEPAAVAQVDRPGQLPSEGGLPRRTERSQGLADRLA